MFSPRRYFEVFATTMLLLVGLPQFIVPILKGQAMSSGAAHAQSMPMVRLSRRVNYNNAGSADTFQDDQLSYSLTLENHEGSSLTGTPLYLDGQSVERVMVASVIPAGTYLAGTPYAPPGWQTIYSTDDRQQTGRRNNDTQISWTSYRPDSRNIRRVAFVKTGALDAYEIVDGMSFGLSLEDTPAYAPGIRNTVEFYANAQGMPTLIAADENFYTDIDGIALAQTNQGKPAEEPEDPAPLAALDPAPLDPIEPLEVPAEPILDPADPPLLNPTDPIEASVDPVIPPVEPVMPAEILLPEATTVVSEPGPTCSFNPIGANVSVGVHSASGGTPAYPYVSGFVPVNQVPGENLTYVNAVGRLDDFSAVGADVLVGHRFYDEGGDRIYGGYIGYDLETLQNTTFNQLGVGVETLGQVWDAHLNVYLPLEVRQVVESGAAARIARTPLTTVEAEVGAKIFDFENAGEARAYVAPYYYTGAGSVGGRVGVTAEPINGVTVGANVQSDAIFDTQVAFNINYTFGGGGARRTAPSASESTADIDSYSNLCDRLDRLDTPVRRTAPVRVQTETLPPLQPGLAVSDRTLKENIEFLGETSRGFRLYAFDYQANRSLPTGRFVGVMAQDLLQVYPEAVYVSEGNTFAVDYAALGLQMVPYAQWMQSGMEAVLVD